MAAAGIVAFSVVAPSFSAEAGRIPKVSYEAPRDPTAATSSGSARASAIRAIPFEQMDQVSRAKVQAVLSNTTIFRRMPTRVVPCDPNLYLFLVRHPDVVVNIWDVLGIAQMTVREVGPQAFHVADGVGTLGMMQYLFSSHDTHVIYAEGRYQGQLLAKPVHGRSVVVLRTGYVREPDGRYYITSRMDAFIQINRGGAELLTKTLEPLVARAADINFVQTVAFFGSLSRTAEVNEPGVQRLATRLKNVRPEIRREFAEVAQGVGKRAIPLPYREVADARQEAYQPEAAAPPTVAR